MTFKELEWDYLPMIVLFSVVSGILALLFILLIVDHNNLASQEFDYLRKFRIFNNYVNEEEQPEAIEEESFEGSDDFLKENTVFYEDIDSTEQ